MQLGSPYQLPLTNTNQTAWLDQNTTWTTSTIVTAPSGTEQWVCSAGNSGTITQATSINSTYAHQYYLTVISPSPANVPTSGSGWYNAGSAAYAGLDSGTVSSGTGAQWAFANWTTGGDNYQQSNVITMNSAVTSTAVWNLQYYLNVTSAFGSPTGGGWYNAGYSASFGVTTPFSGGAGIQYLLNSWSGSGAGSCNGSVASNSVTINNPIVESANWTTQYYLSVNDNGVGTSVGSGWYDSGSSTQAAVSASIVSGGTGTQYVFSGWTGDASGSDSTSSNMLVNSPETAIASWITQYQVTFVIAPSNGGLINPIGVDLWVNSGPLPIHALPDSGYTFSQWTSNSDYITFDNSNAISTTANVNGPGVITASLVQTPTATPQPTPITTASPTRDPVRSPSPSPLRTSAATPNVSPAPTASPKPAPEFPDLSVIIVLLVVVSLSSVVMVAARKQMGRNGKTGATGKKLDLTK
jgi:cell division septation protein DedD